MVLTLVETPRHEKDGTQDQHGDHASGQKTAAVTSYEMHHVGSRKQLFRKSRLAAKTAASLAGAVPPCDVRADTA
jgi:hypothetical protein